MPSETTRPPLVRTCGPGGSAVHGGARRRDRERRPAVDPDRPPLQRAEPAVGDHRLRDHVRRLPAARRPPGRPARPAPVLHRGHCALHGQLPGGRIRLVGGLADHLPRDPGPRRRAARARGALDPDDDLRRGPRAQRRARRLGRGLRQRRRGRRAARRLPDELARLVVDLLHQRPRRDRADRGQSLPPEGEPRRARTPHLRLRGCRHGHERPDAAGLRDDARGRDRLGHRRDDRPARRLRGADPLLRRDRAALEGAAACRCGSSACARSPART